MIAPFAYVANPGRVVFGSGTIEQLPAKAERLGLKRVIVLSTPQQEGAANTCWNPRKLEPAPLRDLIVRAGGGRAASGLTIGDGT